MILYYSGTGNSRWAASVISSQTGDELVSINDIIRSKITDHDNSRRDFHSERPYVFVCPTYCWNIPRVVEDFIRSSCFSGCTDVYFFLTCGSGTGAAAGRAESLCKELGFNFRGLGSVKMPENYIAMFDPPSYDEALTIIRSALSQIESTARLINVSRSIEDANAGRGILGLSTYISPLFYKVFVKDKHFSVSEGCISCGKCAQLCPLANISLVDGKPVWNGSCTHCMACIGACPSNAIEYGRSSVKRRKYYLYADGKQKQ